MLRIMLDTFVSIPEEMGRALRRTAYSPNIKERLDASCALFDGEGILLAQAEHIPVHLGSMPMVVKAVLESVPDLEKGDAIVVNDPAYGGTHLPDITVIMPVFRLEERIAFVVTRAHHSDIGGMSPGSMPAGSRELFQEGLIIPPIRIMQGGKEDHDAIAMILANSRTPKERLGDLRAQLSACLLGKRRVLELVERYGLDTVQKYATEILDYAQRVTRERLSSMPDGTFSATENIEVDLIDGSGMQREKPNNALSGGDDWSGRRKETQEKKGRENDPTIRVTITIRNGRVTVDFTGTDIEIDGNINAPPAVAHSAVAFVFRCLAGSDIPNNDGCTRDLNIILPEGTILNPSRNRAVCSGNVETSQRIVECLFSAMSEILPDTIPAGSQGTMNNVIIGGPDFSYYETLGGGEGAHSWRDGESGVHTGMTNTANTPIEAIELAYPLRIMEYSLIDTQGGDGMFRGGRGIRRSIEILARSARLSILSNNRRSSATGRQGGENGEMGHNAIHRNGEIINLTGMADANLQIGDIVVIETPGGGGWGKRERRKEDPRILLKKKIGI